MSVMVDKLYRNGLFPYKMVLLTGEKGLNIPVRWALLIEDEGMAASLRGGELVFTAGLRNTGDGWLLRFAQELSKAGASALIVSLGSFTRDVPREVTLYCEKADLPLFTIPPETRVVDMIRDFCQMILSGEQRESAVASTLKNILFHIGDQESQILQLERYGVRRDSRFTFVAVRIRGVSGCAEAATVKWLKEAAERTAKKIREPYIAFAYRESWILVLVDYSGEEIDALVDRLTQMAKVEHPTAKLHMGVGSNKEGLGGQNTNFTRALSALEVAKRNGEAVKYYDRLGIYKLLYALNDISVLREFYSEVIGKLEDYDEENKTQLMIILKSYLDNNGSLQLVSEKRYVHRNTVTNQLKKIESITGLDPFELEHKLLFRIGFCIKEML